MRHMAILCLLYYPIMEQAQENIEVDESPTQEVKCTKPSCLEHDSILDTNKNIDNGWAIVDNALSAMGIDITKVKSVESDDELRDRAMLERLAERGLL